MSTPSSQPYSGHHLDILASTLTSSSHPYPVGSTSKPLIQSLLTPQLLLITLVPAPIICLPEWSLLLPLSPEVSFQPKCQVRPCHCSAQNHGRAPCFIRVKARDRKTAYQALDNLPLPSTPSLREPVSCPASSHSTWLRAPLRTQDTPRLCTCCSFCLENSYSRRLPDPPFKLLSELSSR